MTHLGGAVPQLEERLLDDILGIRVPSRHAPGHAVDEAMMALDNGSKGVSVALGGGGEEHRVAALLARPAAVVRLARFGVH